MSIYPEKALGEILKLDIDTEAVQPDKVYTTAGIYSYGRGLFRRATIFGAETKYKRYTRLHEGQFVYSKLFGWEGALAVVTKEFDGLHVSHEFPTFTVDQTVADLAYVRHLARWEGLHAKLRDQGTGMGSRRQRVNINRLLATTVPLPDLEEQRRIAARLDTALERFERVEKLRDHRSRLCSALSESVIGSAIESAESIKPISEVMTLTRRPVTPEPGKTYREIGIRSFGRGVFHKEPVTSDDLGNKRVFAIEPGDLLFSNVFAWEGAVALAGNTEAGFIGSHRFMTYRVNENVADSSYLRHYFTCKPGLEVIRRTSPGSAGRNKTLGIKNFEAQRIPLPSLGEQRIIGCLLDTISAHVRENGDAEVVAAFKPSLLNKAFSGEL